jgi:iodotyrosine deiodinase
MFKNQGVSCLFVVSIHSKTNNLSKMSLQKDINGYPHIAYERPVLTTETVDNQALVFYEQMDERRTVRDFSDRPIPRSVIDNLILTASTAPSGAHKQPWTFCVVSDPTLKKAIREAAEQEEFESYNGRMPEQWLRDLAPLATDWHKPFLEIAPYLIVVFAQSTGANKEKHYYVQESVGIACGFLIAAIHAAGLVTLTHTPSPMNFLKSLLKRPDNERPFLLLPVGYAAETIFVPDIQRKPLSEIAVFYE